MTQPSTPGMNGMRDETESDGNYLKEVCWDNSSASLTGPYYWVQSGTVDIYRVRCSFPIHFTSVETDKSLDRSVPCYLRGVT